MTVFSTHVAVHVFTCPSDLMNWSCYVEEVVIEMTRVCF